MNKLENFMDLQQPPDVVRCEKLSLLPLKFNWEIGKSIQPFPEVMDYFSHSRNDLNSVPIPTNNTPRMNQICLKVSYPTFA